MSISKYPPSPSNVDTKALNPTKEYKLEVMKVSGAIMLFFLVVLPVSKVKFFYS